MQYLNDKFFKFFDGLSKNNNKEWFEKNRATYENEVKKPFRKPCDAPLLNVRIKIGPTVEEAEMPTRKHFPKNQ